MKTIDKTVLAGYNEGIKRDKLRKGIGLIEFERTKEIFWNVCRNLLLQFMISAVHTKSIPGGWLLNRVTRCKAVKDVMREVSPERRIAQTQFC